MNIEKGDYIVAGYLDEKTKPKFLKVNSIHKKYCVATVIDVNQIEPQVYNVQYNNIWANCGPNPHAGSAYGIIIEAVYDKTSIKGWGKLYFMMNLSDRGKRRVIKHITKLYYRLKKKKLHKFLPVDTLIKERVGYKGMYKYLPKGDFDIIHYALQETIDDLDYVLYHEVGHGIWYRQLSSNDKSPIIDLYHQCIDIQQITDNDLKDILEEWIKVQEVSEYNKLLDEKERMIFKGCLRWIKQIHKLSKNNLQDIIYNKPDTIRKCWPTRKQLVLSTVDPIISNYGATSPEEFYAEAFANYWLDRSLPKKVHKAIRTSLSSARKNGRIN